MITTLIFLAALACDGVTDDTAAFNDALLAAETSKSRTVELPAGRCVFDGTPNPIRKGVNVIGRNKSSTILEYKSGGGMRLCDNGSTIRNLTITTGPSNKGSIGFHVTNCDGLAAGNHVIEHIWITSLYGKTWTSPLILDGSLRTQAPQGLRTVTLNDVSTFNATWWSAMLWNCVGCEWRGGGSYQGAGSTEAVAIGGPMGVNNRIDFLYNKNTSVIWPTAIRNP